MKLKVYNSKGTSAAEKEFSNLPVLEDDKGMVALRQYLIAVQANMRQGSACTKDRGDVSGTGKKPWRQKGTGNARHGSKRSPLWPGGGVVFGPKPRDYSQKVNKKVKKLALLRSFWDKVADNGLYLIEEFITEKPKTQDFEKVVNLMCNRGSVLLVDDKFNENFVLSARNIDRLYIVDCMGVNALDLSRYKHVVFSESAFDAFVQRLNVEGEE